VHLYIYFENFFVAMNDISNPAIFSIREENVMSHKLTHLILEIVVQILMKIEVDLVVSNFSIRVTIMLGVVRNFLFFKLQ